MQKQDNYSTRKDVDAMNDQALTPDEAARILKVSPQTVRRWQTLAHQPDNN